MVADIAVEKNNMEDLMNSSTSKNETKTHNDEERNNGIDNIKKLEEKIIRVIKKIRDGRSRPCYQSILTLVNRGGEFTLSMDYLKGVLCDLVSKNLIYFKGDEGNESFYVSTEHFSTSNSGITDDLTLKGDEVNNYINEQFLSTLKN